jgi:hypothetical protein
MLALELRSERSDPLSPAVHFGPELIRPKSIFPAKFSRQESSGQCSRLSRLGLPNQDRLRLACSHPIAGDVIGDRQSEVAPFFPQVYIYQVFAYYQ